MTGAEPPAAMQRRLDAFNYMFGSLEAVAADDQAVRTALMLAIRLAQDAGYLSPAEADAHRSRLDTLRDRLA